MSLHVLLADTPGSPRDRVASVLRSSPEMLVTVFSELEPLERAVEQDAPDIVIVAIDVLAGTKAIGRILSRARIPIVALAAAGDPGAAEALAAGALGVAVRPDADGQSSRQFVDMVRSLSTVRVLTRHAPRAARPSATQRIDVVAIVASTGGPPALVEVLRRLPPEPQAPILIVQHIAEGFASGLADWVSGCVPQQVTIAAEGDRPAPGDVLLAPDGTHLAWRSGILQLLADPPVHGHRPSASVLLHSLASQGPGGLAIVLTGMGTDGADGALAMRSAGGQVICQDADSAVVNGMPGAAVAAGAATEVLPLDKIGQRVARLLAVGRPLAS